MWGGFEIDKKVLIMQELQEVFEFNGLIVNLLEQTVLYQSQEILLTNREFQVLYLLLQYQGQVLSKRQIYEQVTGDGERVDYHTVEITISKVRKKLELYTRRNDFIITIKGRGYKFKK